MSAAAREGRGTEGRVFVSAVVLAAGRATRMGGAKLMLPVGGRPMIQRVVDATLASKVSETIVVVGHEADAVRHAVGTRDVRVVENPHYAEGMSTSLRVGLGAVDPRAAGALILLGDQPFIGSLLLDALIDRFVESGALVVRPSAAGRPANPVLVDVALFPDLAAEQGDVGGRRVIARQADVCLVPVDDPHQIADIDEPHEYEKEKDV